MTDPAPTLFATARPLAKLPAVTKISLIRHAPARSDGRMAGRRDVGADCSDATAIAALRMGLGAFDHLVISPALRCAQTASTLWPERAPDHSDTALWEQDFGDWEGLPYGDLPDLGPLPASALAAHCPPNGESFADICARIQPALIRATALGGHVAIVAHAGTARAGLALATGSVPAALAFQIAPLSVTTLSMTAPDGAWSVAGVNRVFI